MDENNPDAPVWLDTADIDMNELQVLSHLQTSTSSVPFAADVVHHIPVYDGAMVRKLASEPASVRALQQEWIRVLRDGAGTIVIRNGIDDIAMLDDVTATFRQIINDESEAHTAADHFAAAGSNSRIWNAHEKLCLRAPELFARYNANDAIALMCKAWLGPAYQITAQANIVHPGGRAQTCHRDYHMGFQESALLSEYPAHVHTFSPMLTLQAGIAHSDVPVESGPTQLLPFSQKLRAGYLAVTQEAVREHFARHHVQLALAKGDMLFFSPALLHAAGNNDTSDVDRFVNLLQVGSAYGRTMEFLDRVRMSIQLYPVLQSMQAAGKLTPRGVVQAVEACAEGYAFPANMELEPPVGGLAPASAQQLMLQALEKGMAAEDFTSRILQQQALKRSH